MTTIHPQVSISGRQRMALSVLLVAALAMGSKTAHAGAEEAIAGLLVGAILVSAAQDSDARVHYRDVHYRDVHTRHEHYSPRPTHALKQRGHHRTHAVEHKRCGYSHGHKHSKREWRKHKYWHKEQGRKAHKHERYKLERYAHDSRGEARWHADRRYRGDRYGHYDD